jgi:hypothetical protein
MAKHLWWPNTAPPPGTGPWPQTTSLQDTGRSGRVVFDGNAGGGGNNIFGTPQALCAAVFEEPTPSVVQIRVGLAEPSSDVQRTFCFAAASNNSYSQSGLGRLILEYGAGSTTQRVVCDLKSGSYQFPTSEQVKISCQVAATNFDRLVLGPFEPQVNVTGVIAKGTHIEPTLPTFTHLLTNTPAATPQPIAIPDNAREVDLWLTTDTTVKYGAGAPVISLLCLGANGAPQLVRDYAQGIFVPPYPARVWGTRDPEVPLVARSTAACDMAVQFTLDL